MINVVTLFEFLMDVLYSNVGKHVRAYITLP